MKVSSSVAVRAFVADDSVSASKLNAWRKFLACSRSPPSDSLTPNKLKSFALWLSDCGLKPQTVKLYVQKVYHFFVDSGAASSFDHLVMRRLYRWVGTLGCSSVRKAIPLSLDSPSWPPQFRDLIILLATIGVRPVGVVHFSGSASKVFSAGGRRLIAVKFNAYADKVSSHDVVLPCVCKYDRNMCLLHPFSRLSSILPVSRVDVKAAVEALGSSYTSYCFRRLHCMVVANFGVSPEEDDCRGRLNEQLNWSVKSKTFYQYCVGKDRVVCGSNCFLRAMVDYYNFGFGGLA